MAERESRSDAQPENGGTARAGRSRPSGRQIGQSGSLLLALALVIGAVVVLGQGARAQSGSLTANNRPAQQTPGGAKPMRLQRADVHVETPYKGKDLEFNVSLSQTENDCQGSFSNGGYCLRYAMILDEAPVLAGYGMVPASAVHITPGNIVIHIDTAKVPGFVVVLGPAQVVSVNWKQLDAQSKVGSPMGASALGSLGAYPIPTSGPKGTVIAHILLTS